VDLQLWIPLAAEPLLNPGSDDLTNRGSRGLFLTGRLRPGVTAQAAQARLDVVGKQLHEAYPRQWTDRAGAPRAITVIPEREAWVFPEFRGAVSGFLGVLMGVAALVLLICCANLANLMLARGGARRRELAVRLALGATRARLVRQLLTEALLLSIAGGALGVLLAGWAAELLAGVRPPLPVPILLDLTIDARVLGFALAVTLLTTVGFALLPAWRISSLEHSAVIRAPGAAAERHRRLGLRDVLVVAQVAVSLVVLVAAGLFLGSLRNASRVDLGFQSDRVALLPLELGIQGYSESRGREFYAELERRVRALPGVQAASLAEIVPLGLARQRRGIQVEGYQPQATEEMEFGVNTVGNEYFRTLGIPLVRGRAFDHRDGAGGAPVAIVNEAFAHRFWPGADPIGRRFSSGRSGSREVIGVARDAKYASLGEEPQPHFYVPSVQAYEDQMVLLVRTAGDPTALFAGLRREVQALDPDLPLELSTLDDHLGFAVLPQRLGAWVLGAFGATGLLLAALGLYGLLSYVVSQRTPELGIRRALGATTTDVYRLVVRQGMALTGIGLAVGLAGSLGVTRLVSGFLVGISPTDPIVLTAVSLLFALVALAACLLPARRAAAVDPMIALRSE
jgi:predicted permease